MSNLKTKSQNLKIQYLPIIGIEVHVELKTKSKMFCGCSSHHFQVKPNIHTCPVCLGLPGALPVPNQKAIEWCLLIGKALGCQLAEESKFDRKNYFYPDLAKGYQISQYDMPFCRSGKITLSVTTYAGGNAEHSRSRHRNNLQSIRINRVHMEEDTGKLLHKIVNGEKCSLIDFNRCGVPLVEIVTEPDIHSADEAVIYLKKLQQIIRYLEVSDCDMEKGSMRCEINISLRKISNTRFLISNKITNFKLPNYKVEVKNINSFKFVKKAIAYEIKRQAQLLDQGETPLQETRGFNESKQKTYPQRSKEEAHDYRYFPEPDIPEIKIKNAKLKMQNLPELPDEKIQRFVKNYGLSETDAGLLMNKKNTAGYFEQVVKSLKSTLNKRRPSVDKSRFLDEIDKIAKIMINKRIDIKKFTPQQLVKHLQKQKADQVSDQGQLETIVTQILEDNAGAVADFKKGKQEVIGFLIGQVMKETKGRAEAQLVQKMLRKALAK